MAEDAPSRPHPANPDSVENIADGFRVLVLAPTGNDAGLAADFMRAGGLPAVVCQDAHVVVEEAQRGCGVLLLAEEALDADACAILRALLLAQPSWSDLPIAIVTGGGDDPADRRRGLATMGLDGNVTLLERPFRPATLISCVEAALRSRRRQYQVRDLLRESSETKQHLEFVLRAGGLGAWRLDLETGEMTTSDTCRANFGVTATDSLSYEELHEMVHPEDREGMRTAVNEAIRTGVNYRSEYRVITPTGEIRWIYAQGRAAFDASGRATHLAGTTQNITARKEIEHALASQAEALRLADQRKDEFLAMLAHELRNPLASVVNAAALLKAHTDPEGHAWAVGVIERQTGQLTRLIDDLLDVSRITSGKIRLRRELIDATAVIERACETVRPLATQRNHQLVCDCQHGMLWVEADPTRLEQIVLNLLTNAAKYTPAGGKIQLTGAVENGHVSIEVRDNGIGIAPDKLPQMFDLFTQGERSIARSEGGLGIGLTIVRKLVEMHGGTIDADSPGPDRGSTFTIRLPAAPAPVSGSTLPNQVTTAGTRSLNILVVDDNVDTATGLARLLRRQGHQVEVVYDGDAAVGAARRRCPEVILLDIGLPRMSGYDVAAWLRENEYCAHALIIAVSGYGQDDDRRKSKEAGFDHHLVKPIDHAELYALLAKRAAEMQSLETATR